MGSGGRAPAWQSKHSKDAWQKCTPAVNFGAQHAVGGGGGGGQAGGWAGRGGGGGVAYADGHGVVPMCGKQ